MMNYITDHNKYSLAGPPKWWLAKLWDFDPSLVVVPSRQECVYRLTQRRKLKLAESIVNDALFQQSDTQMLASYGLIPVTTILATANWSNPYLFQELANRAPWRQGGAEKVISDVEAAEAAESAVKANATDEHITYLAKDSWKYYRTKIGLGKTIFT